MTHITVIPAYGRDYKSQKEVLEAWYADKDFLCVGFGQHGYINRPDHAKHAPDDVITVRYDNQRKSMDIK